MLRTLTYILYINIFINTEKTITLKNYNFYQYVNKKELKVRIINHIARNSKEQFES